MSVASSPSLLVSVVVAAYNAEACLGACLEALAAQTLAASQFEVIVVDDGSEDATAQAAAGAGARLLRQSHRGAAAARNAGVAQARAPIIVFTDADCKPEPEFLAQLLEPLNDAGVSGSRGVYCSRQQAWVARFVQLEYEERYRRIAHYQDVHGGVNAIDTSSACYRRQDFLAAGGFDERFASAAAEDHELSYRMAQDGCVFRLAPAARVCHHHVDSLPAYIRRKARIGYWKALLATMHPQYAISDSHMTHSLKLQLILVALLWLLFPTVIFWPALLWIWLACLMVFVLSAAPFLTLVARQDPPILLITLPMLAARATAAGAGFAWGLLRARTQALPAESTRPSQDLS